MTMIHIVLAKPTMALPAIKHSSAMRKVPTLPYRLVTISDDRDPIRPPIVKIVTTMPN